MSECLLYTSALFPDQCDFVCVCGEGVGGGCWYVVVDGGSIMIARQ